MTCIAYLGGGGERGGGNATGGGEDRHVSVKLRYCSWTISLGTSGPSHRK